MEQQGRPKLTRVSIISVAAIGGGGGGARFRVGIDRNILFGGEGDGEIFKITNDQSFFLTSSNFVTLIKQI